MDDRYQIALSFYNSGNYEEAYNTLNGGEATPIVQELKKRCKIQIDEQYRFLINDAVKREDKFTAISLYSKYKVKYGENDTLRCLSETLGSIEDTPQKSSVSNKLIIAGISVLAIAIGIGIFINVNTDDTEDEIEVALIDDYDDLEALEEIQPITSRTENMSAAIDTVGLPSQEELFDIVKACHPNVMNYLSENLANLINRVNAAARAAGNEVDYFDYDIYYESQDPDENAKIFVEDIQILSPREAIASLSLTQYGETSSRKIQFIKIPDGWTIDDIQDSEGHWLSFKCEQLLSKGF